MMHARTISLTATLLGGVLIAGTAAAQNAGNNPGPTPRENTTATPDNGTAPACPTGCVPVTASRTHQALTPAQRARREEARRQREEARLAEQQRLADERAQAQQDHQGLMDCQRRAEQERQARLDAEHRADQEHQARVSAEQLAERERFDLERERARAMVTPVTTVARGGGPAHHGYRPDIAFALEGGVGDYNHAGFDSGTAHALFAGPSWGARIDVGLLPWLAVQGRYIGMFNPGRDMIAGEGVGFVMNGTSATLRLMAPIPFVRPYIFGGVGVYHASITGSAVAQQTSPLRSDTSFGVPVGAGVDVPLSRHWGLGAEGTFHILTGETFSTDPTLSDSNFLTANAFVRYTL